MSSTIAENRKARHEYHFEEEYEAGLVLQGWEVKSLRDNRVSIAESYITIRKGEAWLIGAHVNPLLSASTHIQPDPTRSRKLLLHRQEIRKLIGQVKQKGYTLIPSRLYWKKGIAKLNVALAKGKKQFDKREDSKQRDWDRQKQRLMKHKQF